MEVLGVVFGWQQSAPVPCPWARVLLFMVIQLFLLCCLVLLSQESVSSLGRKQERVLAVQLRTQNLEGGDGEGEDLTSQEMSKRQKAARFAWVLSCPTHGIFDQQKAVILLC